MKREERSRTQIISHKHVCKGTSFAFLRFMPLLAQPIVKLYDPEYIAKRKRKSLFTPPELYQS